MTSAETLEIAKREYQAGREAFERGQYRESVEHLEKASALLVRNTRLGGEVQIWLVTAYQAAGRQQEAISLCQQLKRHPHAETNKQARRLLYILEAPQLKRPAEWMTQIPDLATLSDNETKSRFAVNNTSKPSEPKKPPQPEPIDLSQVNTRDNRFIWVALLISAFILGGLIWASV